MKITTLLLLTFLFFFYSGREKNNDTEIKTGAEILISDSLSLLNGKNIALVCNHTSIISGNVHLSDTLINSGINLLKIFSPEHGFTGTIEAGKLIDNVKYDGPEIISLYGSRKKPNSSDLNNIDLVIFDIQDIGTRFYTYISTLYYIIEACIENQIPLIVLDRPNPLGGVNIAGPVVKPGFESFISIAPIPIIHGMTIGELALFFESEILNFTKTNYVSVIKLKNWKRDLLWKDLNKNWVPPSPNMPDFETAFLYPATCFFEGLNISEGRGTNSPFLLFGSPFLNSRLISEEINNKFGNYILAKDTVFAPVSIPGKSSNPKFNDLQCYGIKLKVKLYEFDQIDFGIFLLETIFKYHSKEIKFREKHFDLLFGSDELRKHLTDGKTDKKLLNTISTGIKNYHSNRKKYLLY